jgi:replicative DNA helicase
MKPGSITEVNGRSEPRVPPQAAEVERAVLAACIQQPDTAHELVGLLTPEAFFLSKHAQVFEAVAAVDGAGHPVGMVNVIQHLRAANAPAPLRELVIELAADPNRTATPAYHARVLQEYALRRAHIHLHMEAVRRAYDTTEDVFENLDTAERALSDSLRTLRMQQAGQQLHEGAEAALKGFREAANGSMRGLSTGLSALDKVIKGMRGGRHIVLAAPPNSGKTALGLGIAKHNGLPPNLGGAGKRVVYFSVEMGLSELAERFLLMDAGVPAHAAANGTLTHEDWELLGQSKGRMGKAKIIVEATPRLHIEQIEARARRHHREAQAAGEGLLVIVDYLQRVSYEGLADGYERGISLISSRLKGLAAELNIPLLSFSQVKQEAANACASGVRPTLGMCRGSGDIENDADVVGYIYRPDAYGVEFDEKRQIHTGNWAEVVIRKHRYGRVGTAFVGYHTEAVAFVNDGDQIPLNIGETEAPF